MIKPADHLISRLMNRNYAETIHSQDLIWAMRLQEGLARRETESELLLASRHLIFPVRDFFTRRHKF
jgi:hypothetical protein